MQPTPGKVRGLQQLATRDGVFCILACDQRGTMARMLTAAGHANPQYADIVKTKLDIVGAVAPYASGVLLDPEYGAAPAIYSRALPGHVGLACSLEETGYEERQGDRFGRLLKGWSVKKIKQMGASAVKLLVYYNPNRKAAAVHQDELVANVAEQCREADIPFLLEALVYPSTNDSDKAAFAAERETLVIETARALTRFDVDLYKVEFPVGPDVDDEAVWLEACQRLNEACRTPWALLSAGAPFPKFCRQLTVACQAGASGFVAGRAIWQEAISDKPALERQAFMHGDMPRRMQKLVAVATAHGKAWWASPSHALTPASEIAEGWYETYSA